MDIVSSMFAVGTVSDKYLTNAETTKSLILTCDSYALILWIRVFFTI